VDLLVISRLRRYLKRKLHLKVDVVSKEFLNKSIKEKVLREAVTV
jgi:predicted nucleotidyltransferase